MENIILLALINLFSGVGNSLASPFFPYLNTKFILTDAALGWIISTYSLASTLFNSLVPFLIKKFSHIKLLLFAAFCEASCTILYGLLIYIPSYKILLFIIFILRIIHGFCSSIIGVVVYSLAVSLSEKEKTKKNLTNMEIGWSLGKVIGPIIGAICFKYGGYILPFLLLGIVLYISLFLAKKINLDFKSNDDLSDNKRNKSIDDEIGNVIYSAEAWIILIGFVVGIVIDCYYYPCLTYHLINNYGLSISIASLFFTIPILVYIIAVGILNNFKNKLGIYFAYLLGLISTSLGPLFVYPITPLPKNIFLVLFGLFLIGAGQAPIFVQGFVLLVNIIKKISKKKDEVSLNDISSTLNNIMIDIGGFVGPIIGGFLTTKYNFNICCIIMFISSCVYLIIFLFYFYENIKNDVHIIIGKKDEIEIKDDNSNEKEKLIENKIEEI